MAVYDDQKEKTDKEAFDDIVGQVDPREEGEMERNAEEGAAQDIADRENGMYNPDGDNGEGGGDKKGGKDAKDGKDKSLSPDQLKDKEESPAGTAAALAGAAAGGPSGKMAAAKSVAKKLIKNKWAIGVSGGLGVAAVTLIMLFIFALGFFKIPHFGEHIVVYQFARITRHMYLNSKHVHNTKIAVDSANDSRWSQLKAKYGNATGKVSETWSRLDKFRPNKVIKNMDRNEVFKFEYDKPTLLRPNGQLKGLTVGNTTYKLDQPSFGARLIPGVKLANNAKMWQVIEPQLKTAMATQEVGPLVRSIIGRKIRQQLGITLIAWTASKYVNKTPDEAKLQMQRDYREKVRVKGVVINPKFATSEGDKINDTVKEADAAEKAALDDPEKAKHFITDPNNPHPDVVNVLDKAFDPGVATHLKTALGFVNPIYAVAAPVCMIYEGSMVNSGPTMTAQSEDAQRAFVTTLAGSDQIKDGYQSHLNAAGAMGWKLGQIEESNPEIRASGGFADSRNTLSSQASPTGEYTLINTLVPGQLGTWLDTAAQDTCPIFTNLWVGVGLAALNIAGMIASFGSSAGANAVAQGAIQTGLRVAVTNITSRIISKIAASKVIIKKFASDTIKMGAVTALGVFLGKMIVLSQMGANQSPLATGKEFANWVDSGGNQHANEMSRQSLYGAPLPKSDVEFQGQQDAEFIAARMREQSAFERYLSPASPDSLLTRVASIVGRNFSTRNFTQLFNIGSSFLNPVNSFGSTVASLSSARVGAAPVDTYNYGNVQYGLTKAEMAKVAINPDTNLPNDETYEILTNQLILDESGKEAEIEQKYGKCFDPQFTIGDLLTEETGDEDEDHYIVRDAEGNVSATQGLCSVKHLSFGNPKYGDLVFRWRWTKGLNSMLDVIEEKQNPVAVEGAAGSTGGSTGGGGPCVKPIRGRKVTTPFGKSGSWSLGYHTGIDLSGPNGDNVYALCAGKVRLNTEGSAYGRHILLDVGGGDSVMYAHLSSIDVADGQTVTPDQVLGQTGMTGRTFGPHLHFEYCPNGKCYSGAKDPIPFLKSKGVTF